MKSFSRPCIKIRQTSKVSSNYPATMLYDVLPAQLRPISTSPSLQTLEFRHSSPYKPQEKCNGDAGQALPKKIQRAKLVLDCRIELTDEELKVR